ncbi:MAG: class I SAM-dependent methyltransferase [Egibacteraceae bacterium]
MGEDWRTLNRANWDERVSIHVAGEFYDVEGWKAGRDNLESFELEELGDVRGRDLVHLQCHFGLDTLSWARHGALVTGLDFSGPAIAAARSLASEVGLDARFVQADVYDAPAALGEDYDIVYTTHGVLGWHPDLDRWAGVVDALLRPGGTLYLSEYHPVSWMFAEDTTERRVGDGKAHDYFAASPLEYEAPGTYADLAAKTAHNRTVEFQHTLGAVVTAIAERGLVVEFLHERDFTHFPQFDWLVEGDDRRYHQPEGAARIPLLYSLRARKPA